MSEEQEEPECNGICLWAADIGVPEAGNVVAYAHPDCPAHGDPQPEDPNEEVCGGGDESLRYIREEDVSDELRELQGQGLSVVRHPKGHDEVIDPKFTQVVHPGAVAAQGLEVHQTVMTPDWEDDAITVQVRIRLGGCDATTYVEIPMDSADLDVARRIAKAVNEVASGCQPNMRLGIRCDAGDVEDDEYFTEVAL